MLYVIIGTLLAIGAFSMVYYFMIILYAGVQSSFSWFWLLICVGCFCCIILLMLVAKNQITLVKPVKVLIISIVSLGISIFAILEGAILLKAYEKPDENAEYMIVLGAQVRGTKLTRALKSRLDTATEYLLESRNTIVIVSGGQGTGEKISEAQAMKEYLIKQGIDKSRIMEERNSKNTNQNIRFSKVLMKGQNNRVVIVSNDFHIFRATGIAKKQNIGTVEGLGASAGDILILSYYVREVFAVIKDVLHGNL